VTALSGVIHSVTMRIHPAGMLVLTVLLVPAAAGAADPSLDAVLSRFERGQRLRVKTSQHLILRGRFLYAPPDSLYLHPRSYGTDTVVGVERNGIDALWTVGPHGLGRGLLWAGGAALGVGAIALAGSETLGEGDLTVLAVAAAVIIPVAMYKGYAGEKGTLVYEPSRSEGR
jgi:hypothetical protein